MLGHASETHQSASSDEMMDFDNAPQSTSYARLAIPQSAPRLTASHMLPHICGNSVPPNGTLSASSRSTAKPNHGHAYPSALPEPSLPPRPSSDDNDNDNDISTVSSCHTSRLPSIPPLSVRQHMHLWAIQKSVDAEKERFKKLDH